MSGLQKAKSEETQRRVLEAAIAAVEQGGLDAVNIRQIAGNAGYSVGSVYKHYKDQDALLLAVNSVTLGRIKSAMLAAIEGIDDPVEELKALAQTYLGFARQNRNLWTTLFAHFLPEDKPVPDWHIQENISLLGLIAQPLKGLNPDMGDELLAVRTRTCFAAVHGLVAISLEGRFVSLAGETLEDEMDFLVERLVGF
ncbi:MAG: TetR/AcrR family transcriptional regulator [Roseibium sp.]|uniref:TetR/AcrR family transcriptional regulator n=1 Tax=Roseibium sp. TaxID=1936156 RepID=UPI001B2405F3|nr:TetR/AcrR family transcriptional regulator [Roseibium sp.]MBO6511686.1 TetR/AcrR family transcriptional regulator [Roseibium sp.]MBO6894301.1 TetR/AcrR family transcriptional regulator [Roseibium sp.]MBO6930921.1 TetR/AcrR family transcriptional regulator [Roseibium sp.]